MYNLVQVHATWACGKAVVPGKTRKHVVGSQVGARIRAKDSGSRVCRCTSTHQKTEDTPNEGFFTPCGRWYLRSIREEDVPAVADIQTDAFHEQFAFQPMDNQFKKFFRVRSFCM
jgi:hypothetical protein